MCLTHSIGVCGARKQSLFKKKREILCYTRQSKCVIALTLLPPSGSALGSSSTKQFCTKILECFHFGKERCLEETSCVAKVQGCGRDWPKSLLPSFRSQISPD